jgi:integrase/recombinase XerD
MDCMDHIHAPRANEPLNHAHMRHASPLVSALLPDFLEYLRVEEQCTSDTVLRYQKHMQAFLMSVGDCPIGAITSEKLAVYKRQLFDRGLSAATIATMLSGLRSFLRYLRDIRGLEVYDPAKVRRPAIPKREVDYLSKEEMQRFLDAIPTHTYAGLRDRALAEVLCASGMRIAEALSVDRPQIDWEAREARIIGKGNKQRKVYFSDTALEWLHRYLQTRHDAEAAVFLTQGDPPQRMRAQGTWKRFHRYAQRAGLNKTVYPHMHRHTMATTLLANGCPIGHIRTLLGHEHLSTTCKYHLGVMSDTEAKEAHTRYLSYQSDTGEKTDMNKPGGENTDPWRLDI